MRFGTKVLLLQLLTVATVVAVCAMIFTWLAVEQLKAGAESSALSIARTVAAEPEVRSEVARRMGAPETSEEELASGVLQVYAADITARTGALFVVIADVNGIRLAHPEKERLGEQVSTSYEEALRGQEVIAWEAGTLGESARAKVPVYAPGTMDPVGEVSVGFERTSVFDDLPRLLFGVSAAAAVALAVGVGALLFMRRRWEQLTLGLQPEELVSLVQNQAAVLDGVDDGVISLDLDGIVRVCNEPAARMLGFTAPEGRAFTDLGLPMDVVLALRRGEARDGVVFGDRVLYLDSRSVEKDGQRLGSVIIVRDRTDLVGLSERLGSVRAMTSALRVQRHEFANRMHVATGLLDAGRVAEAGEFLREMRDRGPVNYPLTGGELLAEPFLQSFLGAKSMEAGERGVTLRLGEETLVLGTVAGVEDTATVLGNLVDNAITAAAAVPVALREVEVTLMDEGGDLVLVVADTGTGIASDTDVFDTGFTGPARSAGGDTIHGHGIGLTLCRELVNRRGGDLWIIDPGGQGSGLGAVFGARLPGVMEAGTIVGRRHDQEKDGNGWQ